MRRTSTVSVPLALAVLLLAQAGGHGQAPVAPPWPALAKTPPMGWNSWNRFGCNVSEQLIRETADAMVSSGMKDAGYQFVVIDDCWQIDRDAQGRIVPDPKRFPSGTKALADYVHSKGLKFGRYSDAGTMTCQRRPGSLGYEREDAQQYAAWGLWAILAAPLMVSLDIDTGATCGHFPPRALILEWMSQHLVWLGSRDGTAGEVDRAPARHCAFTTPSRGA